MDQVTDSYGNGMAFTYHDDAEEGNLVATGAGGGREVATYPDTIFYNNATPFNDSNWQSSVVFTYHDMEREVIGTQPPIFANHLRLDGLSMYNAGQLIWDYQLSYNTDVFAPNGTSIFSLVAIQQRDFNGQATLPATTFGYLMLTNGWNCMYGIPPEACLVQYQLRVYYNYPRLETVNNGYGGVYRFSYNNIEHNGVKSYYVTKLESWDGFENNFGEGDLPTTIIDYQRSHDDACFDYLNEDEDPDPLPCGENWPSSNKLVGFVSTTITTRPGNSSTYLTYQVSQFHVGNTSLIGKPTWQGMYYPVNGTDLLSEKAWSWSGDDATCPQNGLVFDYICLWKEQNKSYYYPAGGGYTTLENWTTNSYTPQYQGNRQWGLVTQQELWYKMEGGNNTRHQIQINRYRANATTWVIVPWATATYNNSWQPQTMAINLYDNQLDPDDQAITNGRLTLTRQFWLEDLDPGSGLLYKTIDTAFSYDSYGNQSSLTSYQDYGQVGNNGSNWNSWTPAGNGSPSLTLNSYYKLYGRQLDSQQDPAGNETSYPTYHTRFTWLPTTVIDPNNRTTAYAFDDSARLLKVARPGDSLAAPTMQYGYTLPTATTPFRVSTTIQPAQTDPALHRHTVAHYNGFGQLVQSNLLDLSLYQVSGLRDQTVRYGYDALGRKVCESVPFAITGPGGPYQPTPCSSMANKSTTTYDYRGGVRYTIEPSGATTTRLSLIPGNWVSNVGSGAQQEYIQDAKGNITVYTQDPFGQLDWVGQYDNNNCLQVTDYSHTLTGNLTEVVRGGTVCGSLYVSGNVTTTMTYDELGRKTAMVDPDMGSWSYGYDPAGNLTEQIANDSLKLCFSYDNLNRLLSKFKNHSPTAPCNPADPASEPLASYNYRTTAPAIGQLDSISWGPEPDYNHDTFTYDGLGRLTEQNRWLDGRAYRFKTSTFDLLHRPLTIEYPTGELVTISYDREGGPDSLTAGADPLVLGLSYNERGQLRFIDRPNTIPDTTYNYFSNTNNYRLSNITTGTFFNSNYSYDPVGNIASITDIVPVQDEKQFFSYDRLNRLVTACATTNQAHTNCNSNPTVYNHTYSYDTLGNLTSYAGQSYSYTDPSHKQAVTAISPNQTFAYDAHGNMITRTDSTGNYSQGYDPENRLITVNKSGVGLTAFAYDANGQRTTALTPDGNLTHTPFPTYETTYHTPTRDNFSLDPLGRWTANTGTWQWNGDYYDGSNPNQQALATLNSPTFTSNGTLAASIQVLATNPNQQNGFLIYDYQSNSNYKFAGIDALNNLAVVGYRSGSNVVSTSSPLTLDTDQWYDVKVVLSGNQAKLYVNGIYRHQYTYSAAFTGGKIGFRVTKGQSHFDNLLFTNSQTARSLYALGNQTIATRVTGDPTATNNGLFYIFSDHLGSTSVLAYGSGGQTGAEVPGSRARYYPFGSPRTAPTQTITDRNFTGQKENLELGLIYYNARYYVPTIGKFTSPDPLNPDPLNPQQFNRYTYTLNNPLKFTDSSGHCLTDTNGNPDNSDIACWEYLWELENTWGIDIQGEEFWDYLYLTSLQYIFEQFSEFVGSQDKWTLILKTSAKIAGNDKFIVSGDMGAWDDYGRCNTGCNVFGEVRFNLPVAFSIHNPAAARLGDFYKVPINNGRLTMAHEFSHILFGTSDNFIFTQYQMARGWIEDSTLGNWSDSQGVILDYDNPAHFFTHVVALYVSAGNSWNQIDPHYFADQTITPYEQMWIIYARLDFAYGW